MTDLSGIQQAVQKIAEQTVQDQAKSGGLDKGAASADDIQKLQAALNQPPAEANAANAVQATERVTAVDGIEPASPGGKILDSVNSMRTGFQGAMQEMSDVLANGDLTSPADMLKVQMKFQQVSIQQDLLSKVVAKSEQNVDQLLKGQ